MANRRERKYRRLGRQENVRPDGRITQHEQAIRTLLANDERIQRNGFRLAVETLWERIQNEVGEDDPEPCPETSFIPDAFMVNERDCYLELFEVEDWGPIRANKRLRLGKFWFEFDCDCRHDWLPRLWLVNRYGLITTELPMSALYAELLASIVQDERELGSPHQGRG